MQVIRDTGKKIWGRLLVAAFCVSVVPLAHADYPDKSITFISPYAAGGANDFLTRLMARYMGEELKVSGVVENRIGANGIVGASYVAKAAPDGYTLLMGNSATHGTNPTLYKKLPFDADKDFKPVAMVGSVPVVLAVNTGLGVNSLKELIEYGKTHKLSFGSSGLGGTGHLTGEAFKAATGLDMVHVPYKGDSQAVTDAMGGQVSMAFVGTASATSLQSSGKIKILAVAHKKRTQSLPNVPTFSEQGFPQIEFSQWYALFVPAGTPDNIIQKLSDANAAALKNPEVQKNLNSQSAESEFRSPKELRDFYHSEIQRFGTIIQKLNIKLEQ